MTPRPPFFVIQTDAPCKACSARHEYVTHNCAVVVWEAGRDADWIASHIEGSKVQLIHEIPADIVCEFRPATKPRIGIVVPSADSVPILAASREAGRAAGQEGR
jgi:hypothetical protein